MFYRPTERQIYPVMPEAKMKKMGKAKPAKNYFEKGIPVPLTQTSQFPVVGAVF